VFRRFAAIAFTFVSAEKNRHLSLELGAAATRSKTPRRQHDRHHPDYKRPCASTRDRPTASCLAAMDKGADLQPLRAGFPRARRCRAGSTNRWMEKTGKPMLDARQRPRLLHIFISNRFGDSSA